MLIVLSGFFLATLMSATEAYDSSQEPPVDGPSSGSATPPLSRYNYGSSDSPINSYTVVRFTFPNRALLLELHGRQTSTRKNLLPSFMMERSQTQQLQPQYSIRQRGSMGDQTRKTFYKLLTAALLSRCIFLPCEAYIYYNGAGCHPQSICLETLACSMARSLPDLAFASTFSILVFFCAQLAGTTSVGGPRGMSLVFSRRGVLPWETSSFIHSTLFFLPLHSLTSFHSYSFK